MSRVFCTQIPHRIDPVSGDLLQSVNINPASEFGEVEVMMSKRASFFATNELSKLVVEKLKDFDHDVDCLLPLGDPVLIATVCAQLGRKHSYFDVLRWDKNLGRYTKSRVVI